MTFALNAVQLVSLVALIGPIWTATDLTLVAKSSGRDVVEATLAKIQRSNIFPDDKRYLRRLAYVETQDGDSPTTYISDQGGIWRVDEAWFLTTKETSMPALKSFQDAILRHFEIDWSNVEIADLNVPLISALAARLRIAVLQANIPGELYGQAQYWKNHNGRGPADRFLAEADQLEQSEPNCERKMDIVLVLDGSGSIDESNFKKSLEFIDKLTSTLDLESSRVAFIVYSHFVNTIFGLGHITDQSVMKHRILGTAYPRGSTETAEAMAEGYRLLNSASSREGASKVMMVFTDGVADSRAAVISQSRLAGDYDVTNIAIGIGTGISQEELLHIAGQDSGRVFDMTSYQALLEAFKYFAGVVCSVPEKPDLDEVVQDKVSVKEKHFFEYKVPQEGVTVDFKVKEGQAKGYYSFSEPKPSSAIHDGSINGKTFIQAPAESLKLENTTTDLFVSIEGISVVSNYTITTSVGNHITNQTSFTSIYWKCSPVAGLLVLVLLIIAYRRYRSRSAVYA